MADIKDKIKKLLALAESPNEHEARAALLKARALMAEHKLRPDDIETKKVEVVRRTTGVTCTSMTNSWISYLAQVVGEHYCCKSFIQRTHGMKTVEIGFIGMEDDWEVAVQTFKYATESALKLCKKLVRKTPGESATIYRKQCNAYGWGFVSGLKEAFEEQTKENREWGLVMVTPKPVLDVVNQMSKGRFGRDDGGYNDLRNRGREDGKRFDRSRKLEAEKRAFAR